MYSKPILINREFYIYHPEISYTSKEQHSNFTLFTESSLKANCIHSKNLKKTFCRKQTDIEKCNYDLLLRNESNMDCFRRLTPNNYITQIRYDFYISVLYPLNLNLSCANKPKREIRITRPTKILNAHDCYILREN